MSSVWVPYTRFSVYVSAIELAALAVYPLARRANRPPFATISCWTIRASFPATPSDVAEMLPDAVPVTYATADFVPVTLNWNFVPVGVTRAHAPLGASF